MPPTSPMKKTNKQSIYIYLPVPQGLMRPAHHKMNPAQG